ncbi:MAG: hypothetical protein AVDCRST_MAG65-2262, partial [uncultured Solirubrobacteraceae bacterium]
HHPQAVYFGMRNGRLLAGGSPDEIIIGTEKDPTLRLLPPDEESAGDTDEPPAEAALAGSAERPA